MWFFFFDGISEMWNCICISHRIGISTKWRASECWTFSNIAPISFPKSRTTSAPPPSWTSCINSCAVSRRRRSGPEYMPWVHGFLYIYIFFLRDFIFKKTLKTFFFFLRDFIFKKILKTLRFLYYTRTDFMPFATLKIRPNYFNAL